MSALSRRELLRLLAAAPAAAAFSWTDAEAGEAARGAARARDKAAARREPYEPKFFTPHEFATVSALVDLLLPADERSGSATEAGVPEFMDFMMTDQEWRRTAMRGGLAWIDAQCVERWGKRFIDCEPERRTALLDDIAWPDRAPPELSHGVAFFNSFRDLAATGFWTSRMGIEDLGYTGNVFVPEWNGCPDEACRHLGVRYE